MQGLSLSEMLSLAAKEVLATSQKDKRGGSGWWMITERCQIKSCWIVSLELFKQLLSRLQLKPFQWQKSTFILWRLMQKHHEWWRWRAVRTVNIHTFPSSSLYIEISFCFFVQFCALSSCFDISGPIIGEMSWWLNKAALVIHRFIIHGLIFCCFFFQGFSKFWEKFSSSAAVMCLNVSEQWIKSAQTASTWRTDFFCLVLRFNLYLLSGCLQVRMLADLSLVGCYNMSTVPEKKRAQLLLESAKKNLRDMAFFGLTEYQRKTQFLFERTFRLRFIRPFMQYNSTRAAGVDLDNTTVGAPAHSDRENQL